MGNVVQGTAEGVGTTLADKVPGSGRTLLNTTFGGLQGGMTANDLYGGDSEDRPWWVTPAGVGTGMLLGRNAGRNNLLGRQWLRRPFTTAATGSMIGSTIDQINTGMTGREHNEMGQLLARGGLAAGVAGSLGSAPGLRNNAMGAALRAPAAIASNPWVIGGTTAAAVATPVTTGIGQVAAGKKALGGIGNISNIAEVGRFVVAEKNLQEDMQRINSDPKLAAQYAQRLTGGDPALMQQLLVDANNPQSGIDPKKLAPAMMAHHNEQTAQAVNKVLTGMKVTDAQGNPVQFTGQNIGLARTAMGTLAPVFQGQQITDDIAKAQAGDQGAMQRVQAYAAKNNLQSIDQVAAHVTESQSQAIRQFMNQSGMRDQLLRGTALSAADGMTGGEKLKFVATASGIQGGVDMLGGLVDNVVGAILPGEMAASFAQMPSISKVALAGGLLMTMLGGVMGSGMTMGAGALTALLPLILHWMGGTDGISKMFGGMFGGGGPAPQLKPGPLVTANLQKYQIDSGELLKILESKGVPPAAMQSLLDRIESDPPFAAQAIKFLEDYAVARRGQPKT